jgi:hypothetical protein
MCSHQNVLIQKYSNLVYPVLSPKSEIENTIHLSNDSANYSYH